MRQLFAAFYLSIVLGFLRAIFRKVRVPSKDIHHTPDYFMVATDRNDSSISTLVGTVSEHHDAPGWQQRLCDRFRKANHFSDLLDISLFKSNEMPFPCPDEINSPDSPYSRWMNICLEQGARKLAREYPWFKPTIFNESNYPE